MNRHTPIRRKTPFDRISSTTFNRMFRNGAPIPRKPLKKQSKSQQRRLREYYKIRAQYLRDHPACAICLLLDQTPAPSTEVHHVRGRAGKLIFDTRFFAPSCRGCRDVPHNNPKWAREVGLLASAADWNTSPK